MPVTDISHRGRFLNQGNVYLPHVAVIEKIIRNPGVRTFHFNFKDEKLREEFTFESGQFGEYSVFGGIPGLCNLTNKKEIFETVYKGTSSTVNPEFITPITRISQDGRDLILPELHNNGRALPQIVVSGSD